MSNLLALVVPCYNEAKRIPTSKYEQHLQHAHKHNTNIRILFVDDGSTDDTPKLLAKLVQKHPERAEMLALPDNAGKAEAVRRGMLHALESQHPLSLVGYWDSDLATPLDAVAQLRGVLDENAHVEMAFGARVALLGRRIVRRLKRHYAGRVFATLASLVLSLPIYDTQCGAKLFRATPALRTVLTQPFLTKWVFDVEIIARFAALHRLSHEAEEVGSAAASSFASTIFEYPLHEWEDVAGSKLGGADVLRMAMGLCRIYYTYVLHEWPSGESVPRAWAALMRWAHLVGATLAVAVSALFYYVAIR